MNKINTLKDSTHLPILSTSEMRHIFGAHNGNNRCELIDPFTGRCVYYVGSKKSKKR